MLYHNGGTSIDTASGFIYAQQVKSDTGGAGTFPEHGNRARQWPEQCQNMVHLRNRQWTSRGLGPYVRL